MQTVSESKTGVSIIYVNILEEYTEMRPIWDNLRRKIERARGVLPDDVIGPIVNDEFGDVYAIMFSMTGDGFSYMELKDVADDIRDELLRILENYLADTKSEVRRTRTTEFRQQLRHEEDVLRTLLEKLRGLSGDD